MEKRDKKKKWETPSFKNLKFNRTLGGASPDLGEDVTSFGEPLGFS